MYRALIRPTLTVLLAAACGSACGCRWGNWLARRDEPFGPRAPCALRADAPAAEVVSYLNQNTAKIHSWQAHHVKITASGAPVSVNALLAVEAPRNFRLTATSFGSREVDLGSNPEQFWFWNKRSPDRAIHVVNHDAESVAQNRLAIPFQPDWIMEALGVIPLDPSQVTLEPNQNDRRSAFLVSHSTSPDGKPVRKVIEVDMCHGIVRSHSLYDEQLNLIASARLSGHVVYGANRAALPSRIDLDWPQEKLALTMQLGQIEINPRQIHENTWAVPQIEGYQVYEMNRQ